MSKETAVQIFGQSYTINADLAPEYVQKLAEHVDEKLNAIAEGNRMMDRTRMAVLAALAIADELYRAKDELENVREEHEAAGEVMKAQVERCLAAVERALDDEES